MKSVIKEKYAHEIKDLSERLESDGVQYLIFIDDGNCWLSSVRSDPQNAVTSLLEALEEALSGKEIIELLADAILAVQLKYNL